MPTPAARHVHRRAQVTPDPAAPPHGVASAPPLPGGRGRGRCRDPRRRDRRLPQLRYRSVPRRLQRIRSRSAQPPAPPRRNAGSHGERVGSYGVQVSSQRSEADAQSAYHSAPGQIPAVLGGHAPVIRRADLGDKGTYYRAMVGRSPTASDATELCNSLKAAGGALHHPEKLASVRLTLAGVAS